MKMLCVSSEIVLSPVVEDRFTRYRFIPEGDQKQEKGSCWSDSSVWVAGESGQYQIGKSYVLNVKIEEA